MKASRLLFTDCRGPTSSTARTSGTLPYITPSLQLLTVEPKMLPFIDDVLTGTCFVAHCQPLTLEQLAEALAYENVEEMERDMGIQCSKFVISIDGQAYYPHVYTRDDAETFTSGAALDKYEKLEDEERLQAKIAAECLNKQGIIADVKAVRRVTREKHEVAALVGTGCDLARMFEDPCLGLAMNLEHVEFLETTARWKRAKGNFHIQEMNLARKYVVLIKHDSSPWSYSPEGLVTCGCLGSSLTDASLSISVQLLAKAVRFHMQLNSHAD